MSMSKLEDFPSELFVEISDYLDGCDLYNSFFGLNQRINTILDEECHRLHVDLTKISKNKFDCYCQRIIPCIDSRIISLTLNGNNSSTPGQLVLFLSRFPSLSTIFIKLESFRLIDFTKNDVDYLLDELPTLIHLKCLSIGNYQRLMPFNINIESLFNENVDLPLSLRCLSFPYQITERWMETIGTIESFVQQIHVPFIQMDFLFLFLQKFPHLKRLTTVLGGIEDINLVLVNSSIEFHQLRSLNVNIMYTISFERFANFLGNIPELDSLSVEALNPDVEFLEAHRWENVLPLKLSLFRFDLTMTLPVNPDPLELLEPFQSQFWTSRDWFVQCRLRDRGRFFRLSTVQSPIITILYWPDDEILLGNSTTTIYPHVNHIELWWNLSKSTYSICPNVRSIQLYGVKNTNDEPIDSNISTILQCPLLEHVIINKDLPISQSRFELTLIQSSKNVHRLTCSITWLRTMLIDEQYQSVCRLTSNRIRKLILINDQSIVTRKDLIILSEILINLQEITIPLTSLDDLIFLLDNLRQLTMMNIQLTNSIRSSLSDLNKWIEENRIRRDLFVYKQVELGIISNIILWIGLRQTNEFNKI